MEATEIPIPEFLLKCPEFNSDKGFHVDEIKCPITRKKVKDYYKIKDEPDDETKKRIYDEVNRQRNESTSIIVEHAREQEQKVVDLTKQLAEQQQKFIEYQLQTEERFNKLALLLQQAPPPPPEPAPLQAPPPLQSSKSLRQKSILPK